MFPVLYDIKKFLHFESVATDNAVFRLHYKATVILLFTFSLLLGSKQYFGDPISCNVDGLPAAFMNTFCWVTGTFTVRQLTADVMRKEVAHPGIGYFDPRVHERVHHRYYQWVPLVLAVTTGFFYLPRFVWKQFEGGHMAHACKDMRYPNLDDDEKDQPTVEQRRAARLMHFFADNRARNNMYAYKFFACELFNLVNVALQLVMTDVFLNGAFAVYGHEFLHYFELSNNPLLDSPETHMNPAEVVFPKVTSCTFSQHGPGGSRQAIHAICVLPLNILNEKIYYIIWFWYVFLIVITSVGMVYRILVLCCTPVRCWVLYSRMGPYDYRDVSYVCSHCSVGDWFVLRQMSKNIDPQTFSTFVLLLTNHFNQDSAQQKRRAMRGRSSSRMEKLFAAATMAEGLGKDESVV